MGPQTSLAYYIARLYEYFLTIFLDNNEQYYSYLFRQNKQKKLNQFKINCLYTTLYSSFGYFVKLGTKCEVLFTPYSHNIRECYFEKLFK